MSHPRTILYVAGESANSHAVISDLKSAGFEPVSTGWSSDAVALLFVHRRVEAVVLDQRWRDQASLGLARLMKSFRPDVPIVLVSSKPVGPLPRGVDACVCFHEEPGELLRTIEVVLDHRAATARSN